MQNDLISVIIVNHNSYDYLIRCLAPLLCTTSKRYIHDIVIVDNSPAQCPPEFIINPRYNSVKYIHVKNNRGYGAACNLGAANTKGRYILFLNSDVVINEDVPKKISNKFQEYNKVAILGIYIIEDGRNPAPSRFLFPKEPLHILANFFRYLNPKREQATAITLPVEGKKLLYADWVLGAAIGVRRSVFNELQGFDEIYFLYFEEIDLCLRAKNIGWNVATIPTAKAFHKHGVSTSTIPSDIIQRIRYRSQIHYFQKHHGFIGKIFAILDRSCLRWRL